MNILWPGHGDEMMKLKRLMLMDRRNILHYRVLIEPSYTGLSSSSLLCSSIIFIWLVITGSIDTLCSSFVPSLVQAGG